MLENQSSNMHNGNCALTIKLHTFYNIINFKNSKCYNCPSILINYHTHGPVQNVSHA